MIVFWISDGLREFWETEAPKLSAALIFLWLLSLYQDKESDIDFRRAKNERIDQQQKLTLS
jgi:hypothetical protein